MDFMLSKHRLGKNKNYSIALELSGDPNRFCGACYSCILMCARNSNCLHFYLLCESSSEFYRSVASHFVQVKLGKSSRFHCNLNYT